MTLPGFVASLTEVIRAAQTLVAQVVPESVRAQLPAGRCSGFAWGIGKDLVGWVDCFKQEHRHGRAVKPRAGLFGASS